MTGSLRVKRLDFVGSSREDLREFPESVRQDIGYALFEVQRGGKPVSAKPLKGFGGGSILEMVENFSGGTYRAVYTVRFEKVVLCLALFSEEVETGH